MVKGVKLTGFGDRLTIWNKKSKQLRDDSQDFFGLDSEMAGHVILAETSTRRKLRCVGRL